MKIPKFSKNPKKLGQMHEMHEKEGLGPLPSEAKLDLGRKILEDEVWSEREREVLGGEEAIGVERD